MEELLLILDPKKVGRTAITVPYPSGGTCNLVVYFHAKYSCGRISPLIRYNIIQEATLWS
jgi:hypothetical protein